MKKETIKKDKRLIVSEAMSHIGYKEYPAGTNKTKFGEWFGLNGMAWCGIFVSYCYSKAGFQLPNIGFKKGFAGCQTAFAFFKEKGWIVTDPQSGDIVLFDWNKDKRYDHVGIFSSWKDDSTFYSIEGNTAIGNDSNGGQVMQRLRNKSVAVFVRMPN